LFLNMLTTPEKEAFLAIANAVAKANGFVDEKEQFLLDQYIHEMNMDHVDVSQIRNIPLEDGIAKIESDKSKRIIFLEACALAFSDGIFDEEQKTIINKLRKAFAVSEEHYKEYKQWLLDMNQLYARGYRLIAEE
jgi:tellurite resistance protein